MNLSIVVAGALLLTSAWTAASDIETYLGLNEFRHVKPGLEGGTCLKDPWEVGNYFPNPAGEQKRLFVPNSDTLTVKLKGAFFNYAPETSIFRKQKMTVQVGIFAEISPKGAAMSIPGAAGIPGRLVFFSEDHQLNQRRIPDINTNVYGPVLYTGGGLGMKFSLLEFDQSKGDKLADSLLKSIADLGTQASSGVPTYLQGPLTSLFQAAFASAKSKDDLFGQITFVLDDRNGPDNSHTAPLRIGDIVLVRQSDRTKAIPWEQLCYKPSTAEIFDTKGNPPQLSYVVISLVKNAGADAGRIHDALTYERFVAELSQRNTNTGLISSVDQITSALRERATERELYRRIGILEMKKGSITDLERFDAVAHLSKVLYASGLGTKGFDPLALAANPDCNYLLKEKVSADEFARFLMRLQQTNAKFTRAKLETLYATSPNTCTTANQALKVIQEQLFNPQ